MVNFIPCFTRLQSTPLSVSAGNILNGEPIVKGDKDSRSISELSLPSEPLSLASSTAMIWEYRGGGVMASWLLVKDHDLLLYSPGVQLDLL